MRPKRRRKPAAEARRFENYYESFGWESKDGRRYDTPMKRRGLAWMWERKSGAGRLSADYGSAGDRENQAKANAASAVQRMNAVQQATGFIRIPGEG